MASNIARRFDRKTNLSPIVANYSGSVFINGIPCAVVGSLYQDGSTAVGASASVYVNGLRVHRVADLASDGQACIEGSSDTFAG